MKMQPSDLEEIWRAEANDYESRFCGHCNTTTDIKEANFFGRLVSHPNFLCLIWIQRVISSLLFYDKPYC